MQQIILLYCSFYHHFKGSFLRLVVTFSALLILNSCIRYIAPRSELEHKSRNKEIANLGTPQDFDNYEATLKQRRDNLIKERSSLFSGDDSYRLGRGDVMEMSVFGLPELSGELEVSGNGSVTVPLLSSDVPASGRLVGDLRQDLQKKLARFVKQPRITLTMKTYQAHKIAVNGAVLKPGLYPLKHTGTTISEIVAEAGGLTDKAGNRILIVPSTKSGSNQGTTIEIDYEDLVGSVNSLPVNIALTSGDSVIIPDGGTFEVDGEVQKPGSYKISDKTALMGAVAAAGGLTYSAKVDEIEIIRDIGGGKHAFKVVNLEQIALRGQDDLRIRDGDLVRVPSESGRHTERSIVEGINSIFRGVGLTGRVN